MIWQETGGGKGMQKAVRKTDSLSVKTQRNKPMIKLIQTPYGYFFFDTNQNALHEVDQETYLELEKMMDGNTAVHQSKAIKSLIEEGWLSDHRVSEIYNPVTDQVEYRLNHHLSQLLLQVTQACNLCCVYCPFANNTDPALSRSHTGKRMTFEIARKAIDFLAAKSEEMNEIAISFYGGEPLVEFPLIKQCVEYSEETFEGKELRFYITTNATLMSEEVIDYMVKHQFYITFSLDGPKSIHDRHRTRSDGSTTYDLVMETLAKTVAKFGDDASVHVNINMVLNPSDDFDEILRWLEEPVLQDIIIRTAFAEDDNLEKKFPMSQDFRKKITYQLAMSWLEYLHLTEGFKTNVITDAMVAQEASNGYSMLNGRGWLPDVVSPGGPCISGVRKLFVNTDGFFYPCEKVNELSSCMCIGDVEKGFDYEQVKRHINIGQLTSETCKNCWAIVHCAICQRGADGGDELSGKVKNQHCAEVRQNIYKSIRTAIMLQELQRHQDTGGVTEQ